MQQCQGASSGDCFSHLTKRGKGIRVETSVEDGLVTRAALDFFRALARGGLGAHLQGAALKLAKRWAGDGRIMLGRQRTKAQVPELAPASGGCDSGAAWGQGVEVEVLDLYGGIASVSYG